MHLVFVLVYVLVFVFAFLCMFVFVHICISVVHVHNGAWWLGTCISGECNCICICVCTRICICICMYVCICTYLYLYFCRACAFNGIMCVVTGDMYLGWMQLYVLVFVFAFVFMFVFAFVFAFVFVFVFVPPLDSYSVDYCSLLPCMIFFLESWHCPSEKFKLWI